MLGGYGGVGRVLCRLLAEAGAHVVVAGRRIERASALSAELNEVADGVASSCVADASDPESLRAALAGADLLLNATTAMDLSPALAQAAIDTGADYLEMSMARSLDGLAAAAEAKGVCLIDQAGFHPGLPAPLTRWVSRHLEAVHDVRVFMAMDANFVDATSTYEVIDVVHENRSRLWREGEWVDATWRDSSPCDFGDRFGKKSCFPIEMIEMREVAGELGLRHAGVYAAGFNGFVDNVVMPLIMLAGLFGPGFARDPLAKLLFWGCKTFSPNDRGVHFRVVAEGERGGAPASHQLDLTHQDEFHFTAAPVLAALFQLDSGDVRQPGLHMMGLAVAPERLVTDLQRMGFELTETADASV